MIFWGSVECYGVVHIIKYQIWLFEMQVQRRSVWPNYYHYAMNLISQQVVAFRIPQNGWEDAWWYMRWGGLPDAKGMGYKYDEEYSKITLNWITISWFYNQKSNYIFRVPSDTVQPMNSLRYERVYNYLEFKSEGNSNGDNSILRVIKTIALRRGFW